MTHQNALAGHKHCDTVAKSCSYEFIHPRACLKLCSSAWLLDILTRIFFFFNYLRETHCLLRQALTRHDTIRMDYPKQGIYLVQMNP
jgi:hypothetical protein